MAETDNAFGRYLGLEDRLKIEEGIARNLNASRIAVSINRCWRTVSDEIGRGGGRQKYNAIEAHEKAKQRMKLRFFTEKEKDRIIEMRKSGFSLNNIRRELRCGSSALIDFLERRGIEGRDSMSTKTLSTRLRAVEEHIKIIYELLESLNGN